MLREFVMRAAVTDPIAFFQEDDWDDEGVLYSNEDTKAWWVIQRLCGLQCSNKSKPITTKSHTKIKKEKPKQKEKKTNSNDIINISSASSSTSISTNSNSTPEPPSTDEEDDQPTDNNEDDTEEPNTKKHRAEEDSVMDTEITFYDTTEEFKEDPDAVMQDAVENGKPTTEPTDTEDNQKQATKHNKEREMKTNEEKKNNEDQEMKNNDETTNDEYTKHTTENASKHHKQPDPDHENDHTKWIDVTAATKAKPRKEKDKETSKKKDAPTNKFEEPVEIQLRRLRQVKLTGSRNRYHTYFDLTIKVPRP
jgi:hypothetical protein